MYNIPESVEGTAFAEFFYTNSDALRNDSDTLSHFAGRSCYQAWEMEREATATNEGYLGNILKQGHESVLEHGSVTFYVEGVTRNLTHELIRHRHLSYSELSQRYVKMEDAKFVLPPAMRKIAPAEAWVDPSLAEDCKSCYADTVEDLENHGVKGKKAREAARAILPGGMETRIVVSGNHRAWRDMLKKRYSVHADAEIRELAEKILAMLRDVAPGIYQDFPDQPFE
jgi:thymidylate synthase (FAD)